MFMRFYNEKEPLPLITDASGINLEVDVLQVRDRVWFPWNKAPDNTALHLITFANRSLTSVESYYSNIER